MILGPRSKCKPPAHLAIGLPNRTFSAVSITVRFATNPHGSSVDPLRIRPNAVPFGRCDHCAYAPNGPSLKPSSPTRLQIAPYLNPKSLKCAATAVRKNGWLGHDSGLFLEFVSFNFKRTNAHWPRTYRKVVSETLTADCVIKIWLQLDQR